MRALLGLINPSAELLTLGELMTAAAAIMGKEPAGAGP
jgi:hypothetical protein